MTYFHVRRERWQKENQTPGQFWATSAMYDHHQCLKSTLLYRAVIVSVSSLSVCSVTGSQKNGGTLCLWKASTWGRLIIWWDSFEWEGWTWWRAEARPSEGIHCRTWGILLPSIPTGKWHYWNPERAGSLLAVLNKIQSCWHFFCCSVAEDIVNKDDNSFVG